jgi:hypothetical protein
VSAVSAAVSTASPPSRRAECVFATRTAIVKNLL